jgi:CheY-like chemotaxis protein
MNFTTISKNNTFDKLHFLEEFFLQTHDAVFVYNPSEQQFVCCNQLMLRILKLPEDTVLPVSVSVFNLIVHEDDRQLLQKNLLIPDPLSIPDTEGVNIRILFSRDEVRFYNLRSKQISSTDQQPLLMGVLYDITDKFWYEQQQKKSDKTLRELSFITSHELRHEYAKIQSIIQLLDNRFITEEERRDLIAGARQSIQVINSTIFKINHKLSFNQSDAFFKTDSRLYNYSRIVIIDDDDLTNIINQRLVHNIAPDIEISIFTNVNDALRFLEDNDLKGDFLILLDVNFPHSSGWEFLDKYKRFLVQSSVVVLSSSIDTGDRKKARKYETVVDYITKPLSLELVKEMLHQ